MTSNTEKAGTAGPFGPVTHEQIIDAFRIVYSVSLSSSLSSIQENQKRARALLHSLEAKA